MRGELLKNLRTCQDRSEQVLEVVGRTELVDEPLGSVRLLHDALPVVLPDGPGQLVEVHGWPVLALAPEVGHLS